VASGSKDGAVYLWGAAATAPSPASFALPGRIVTWRFTAKGSAVIAINSAGEVTRRSGGIFQNSEALFRTEPCHAAILDVERSRVATASADGRVSVWDWNRRSKTLELAAEGGEAHPVGFVAHGETLLIARGSGPAWSSIEARDLRTGERKQAWPIASVPMGAALVSEDGRHVVFAATKGHAILDLALGQTVLSSPLRARGAAFSPDGGIIAIPLERGTVRLWDAASRQEIATLQGFPLAARQAAFSPDGRRLAVTSVGAEALRVWDTASWEPVLTLPGPVAQNLGATAFSADGNVFGTLMEQRVHLWRAPSWAEIEAAEKERRGR
jgi:WD40 repeat protein